ncbi:hypothetical protein ACWIUD_11680 [Helicobacter sp. 23-1044]
MDFFIRFCKKQKIAESTLNSQNLAQKRRILIRRISHENRRIYPNSQNL